MSDKLSYIIVTEFSTDALIDSVNALMDEYKPQGGPFYSARLTGKTHSLIVAQAMVRRHVATVKSPEPKFVGEINEGRAYLMVDDNIVPARAER